MVPSEPGLEEEELEPEVSDREGMPGAEDDAVLAPLRHWGEVVNQTESCLPAQT